MSILGSSDQPVDQIGRAEQARTLHRALDNDLEMPLRAWHTRQSARWCPRLAGFEAVWQSDICLHADIFAFSCLISGCFRRIATCVAAKRSSHAGGVPITVALLVGDGTGRPARAPSVIVRAPASAPGPPLSGYPVRGPARDFHSAERFFYRKRSSLPPPGFSLVIFPSSRRAAPPGKCHQVHLVRLVERGPECARSPGRG